MYSILFEEEKKQTWQRFLFETLTNDAKKFRWNLVAQEKEPNP